MDSNIALVTFSADAIVRFVAAHPIDWSDGELSKRGGVGDQAGVPPTPSVAEFLQLLADRQSLFTAEDYVTHCRGVWAEWLSSKPPEQQRGVFAKLRRNFYPAMIDSLHVWAMLVETGQFDRCVLDAYQDAIGKTDITVLRRDGLLIRIALAMGSDLALADRQYKRAHRNGNGKSESLFVELPKSRPRAPGNKRWYQLDDFELILESSPILFTGRNPYFLTAAGR